MLRGLTGDIPDAGSPLVDRLFTLECSIRGGAATRVVADRLRTAGREAEWRISEDWEPDVPHAAELGQAISTRIAAGSDPPQAWFQKLTDAVEHLCQRRTRLGLSSDPVLLGAVIRGLGAAGQQLPLALLDAAQALLERRLVGIRAAEMAEALSRHADQEPLARDFASAALASGSPIDASTACARWWLAERWAQIREAPLPVDPEQIREARLVVLSSEAVQNSRARAMAVEAVARSVDRLIVDTPDNLEAARSATMRRRTTELCCWRAVVATGAALLVMFNADTIVARIDSATGVPKPTAPVFQGIFGLGCAVVAFALVTLALELAKLYRGIEMPRVEQAAQVFVPLLAGLAGAILHQG